MLATERRIHTLGVGDNLMGQQQGRYSFAKVTTSLLITLDQQVALESRMKALCDRTIGL